jgi:hypothetical protein
MKALWLICLPGLVGMLVFPGSGYAQEHPRPTVDLPLLIQELVARPDNEDLQYEDLYENLLQYYQQPLNLNKTSREALANLLLLSPLQIDNLLQYIGDNGPLLSLYELQAVPAFDLATIYKILPFVTVQDPDGLAAGKALGQRMIANQHQYALIRWDRVVQERRGFTQPDSAGNRLTSRYAGSPHKYLLRYRNSHARDFSLGFLVEKDAGEKFTWQPASHRYGPDFYSGHLQVYNQGRWLALALGDYQLQFGQGLLLAGGFLVGKGGETITTLPRSNLGIRPFTSVLENTFFRGAAFTYALHPQWQLTGFYSHKKVDASQPDLADSADALAAFAGLQASGLHRTPTEIANKHRVREQVSGGNLTFRHPRRHLTLGLTGVFTHFDLAAVRSRIPYRHFDFQGQDNAVAGINYRYNWQNVQFFGESGRSLSGGWGHVHGLLASLSKNIDASLLYRRYAPDFHSFYGQAFSENTRNSNEQGWYLGFKLKPVPRWEITAYYDLFRFSWLRFRVDAPSRGNDYLVRVLFKPTKVVLFYGQVRGEDKGLNVSAGAAPLTEVMPARRQLYTFYLNFTASDTWQWRSRMQWAAYQHGGARSQGFYTGQEVTARLKASRFTVGYALFDTDDFNARLYVPESDVLFAFAVPVLSGVGSRSFLLYQQDLTRKVDLWIKASHTLYRHQTTIGTGLEEIAGPERTELRCQLRFRLFY